MKKFNLKESFNMKKNRKIKLALLIFVCLIIGISIFSISRSLLLAEEYTEEIKSVEIKSDGWGDNEPGAWKIIKSAEWTGFNKAQITFKVDSYEKMRTDLSVTNKDIVLVLDVSGSMSGNKLSQVKADSKALVNSMLKVGNNTFSLITFSSSSNIITRFSTDSDEIISNINTLEAYGLTSYKDALISVGELLQGYSNQGRDLIVLFITDGYPTSSDHASQYTKLKTQYPYINIVGIQYELGTAIVPGLKQVSDVQYSTNMQTLNEVMYLVSGIDEAIEKYETFDITDYISDYFNVSSVDDIKVSEGIVDFDKATQKVTWTIEKLRTGKSANMMINVTLKEPYSGINGYYPTNDSEEIKSELERGGVKKISSQATPVLKNYYTVTYDSNAPSDCDLDSIVSETHFVYEVVNKKNDELACSGYVFNGWEFTEETTGDVEKISDGSFIMPEHDLTIKAVWGTLDVDKSMEGIISKAVCKKFPLTGEIACVDNLSSEFVTSATGIDFSQISSDTNGKGLYIRSGTENDEYPIYYYRGAVTNNNIIYAGFCWKIVRTTETGGIKLIYNGVVGTGNKCNNTGTASQIGTSTFNSTLSAAKYVGYMYDTSTSSVIKTTIDNWYKTNILNKYDSYLEDTVWCNDRSVASTSGSSTYYGAYGRLTTNKSPSLTCPQQVDKYTLKSTSKNYNASLNGNKLLDYPIALLTLDEVAFAGGVYGTNNNNTYYLYTGQSFWLLSPSGFYGSYAGVTRVVSSGSLYYNNVNYANGVRPSVSLKPNTTITPVGNTGEAGSVDNPYIVQ